MSSLHAISDELLGEIQKALSNQEHWIAYNTIPYLLEKGDMYFFNDQDEAKEFASENISDYDSYSVIHAQSIADLFRQIPYEQHLSSKKLSIMNEQNFEYLKDNIKYMGFGEKLFPELETQLKTGAPQFQLHYAAEVNRKPFEATLNFRKSDNSDLYFFNSYRASLKRNNGETKDQVFYLNKGKGVTAKEAYNLLEGRAVYKELANKEGQPYKAWIQLDFDKRDNSNNHEVNQYHEKYGYKLMEAVGKYAISELKDPEKHKALMQSLQKGNLQAVTIEKEGSISKMFLEANPQYKTVNLYDGELKRVPKEALERYMSVEHSGKDMKQENKKEVKQDVSGDKKQGISKKGDAPMQTKSKSKGRKASL
ncbi:MAG TPA: hypothetical protein VNS32_04830 [Flavisolibacter sp.]|nr:hypothetical protein [Flavisolibacter sp.]